MAVVGRFLPIGSTIFEAIIRLLLAQKRTLSFSVKYPEIARAVSHPSRYPAGMDYAAIYAEYQLEGHTQVLGDWGFGVQWRCDCPEFFEV